MSKVNKILRTTIIANGAVQLIGVFRLWISSLSSHLPGNGIAGHMNEAVIMGVGLSVALGFLLIPICIVFRFMQRRGEPLPFYYLIAAMLEALTIPAYIFFSLSGVEC